MASLGYLGFTITLTKRADNDPSSVLIWAGAGTEAVTRRKIALDLDELLAMTEESNQFKHWLEVWNK